MLILNLNAQGDAEKSPYLVYVDYKNFDIN